MAASAGQSEEQERASPATPPDAEKSKGGSDDGAPSRLCDDVTRNILARLPARTAVACTALSKHHRRLIRSPEFRSLHFRLAPPLPRPHITCVATAPIRRRPDQEEDPTSGFVGFHVAGGGGLSGVTPMRSLVGRRYINVEYVNACNGVVLLATEEYTEPRGRRRRCILWNPAVADVVEEVAIPDPPTRSDDYLTLGLGYGQRSKTYKLLLCRIDVSARGHRAVKSLATFALGGMEKEKQLTELPVGLGQDARFSQNSLYVDGRVYVLDRENLAILAFDVDDETVTSIDLPIEVGPRDLWNHTPSLMELHGRPCVATDYDGGVTLWSLSVDHQLDQWCVVWEVCSDNSYVGSVKGVWDCGGVMAVNLENKCYGGVDFLFLYDVTTEETFKATLDRDLAPEWAESCANPKLCWGYRPTLMSPSSIVGKLDQDKDAFSRDIMKALHPVAEQDKRRGLEETLDVMCFVDFLVRLMQKLPEDLQQVVEMKLMDSNGPDISFERVIFEDEDA